VRDLSDFFYFVHRRRSHPQLQWLAECRQVRIAPYVR
jgi:hypothetical protein